MLTLDSVSEVVRAIKEERVTDPSSDDDLPFLLHFWRGAQPLALVMLSVEPKLMISALKLCIPSFAATGVVTCLESYTRDSTDDREFESGEFQELYEAGRGEEFGITPSLAVTRYQRNPGIDGRGCQNSSRSLRYEIEGGRVRWLERRIEDGHNVGRFSQLVNECFEQPSWELNDQRIIGLDSTLRDVPHQRLHADLGTLRALCAVHPGQVEVGYFADPNDPEAYEIVQTSIKEMGQEEAMEKLWRAVAMITN